MRTESHTPQVSGAVLDLGFLVCLDTDCSRGGWLTALTLAPASWFRRTNEES